MQTKEKVMQPQLTQAQQQQAKRLVHALDILNTFVFGKKPEVKSGTPTATSNK